MKRFINWWKGRTMNEKLMYALILVLVIGIATRWRYVFGEIGDAFSSLIPSSSEQVESDADKSKKPEYVMPTVPTLIAGTEQAPAWMAEHYWDKTVLADSNFAKYPTVLEDAIKPWGEVLLMVDDKVVSRSVKSFMDKVSADTLALRTAIDKVEWAFYDPNSPIRNFEAYIAALEWIVSSDKLNELDKMRPASHLERALKNRKGTKANNFEYVDSKGRSGNLYGIKADYTLLFFNNPDCPSCAEFKQHLLTTPIIESLVEQKRLVVLGIYPDGDEKLWKSRHDEFPTAWINGMDMGEKIEKAQSYELNVIPTLLLLDRDKIVLLKDAQVTQLEDYLMKAAAAQ